MPQVPYNPVPTVAPSTSAGNDYLNVQANPADFGAQVGAAASGVGRTLDQAGDMLATAAIQRQKVVNNVATDAAFNQHQSNVNAILYGDPNDPTKPGFYALHGKAAMDAWPSVQAQLDQSRQTIKDGLANPVQQLGFDEASRRLNMYSTERAGSHYDTEFNRYAQETQKAGIDIKARDVANNWNDDTNFQHNLADALQRADAQSALQGGNDEVFADNRAKAAQTLYTARAMAMGEADPGAAMKFLDDNQKQFAPGAVLQLRARFQGKADQAWSNGAAAAVASGNVPPAALPDAIHAAESGGRATSATSVDGARGGWQIMPATFQQYAKSGESIDSPADNEAVGRRIIADLSSKYDGDAARVAVGYFSGPGNVAPAGSPTPWIADKADGNGQTVSGYVAKVLSRTGTPQGAAVDRDALLQDALNRAPNEQAANLLMLKTQRLWAMQDKAARAGQEAAGNRFVSQLIKDPTQVNPDDIANDPSLTWEQKGRIAAMQKAAIGGDGNHDVKTYGPGFYSLFQQVHAGQDDPSRITDPSALWSHVGPNGDLTVAGVEKLAGEIQGRRTPDGEAESAMKKQFFAMAKGEITGSNSMMHLRDPRGDEAYLKFMAQALPAYDAGRKAGKSASALLDPSSPDYLGKSIGTFKRPLAQWTADMMSANSPGGAMPGAGPAPEAPLDLNSRDGIVAAYHTGKLTRAAAAQALVSKGFAMAPPAAPAPASSADLVPH